MPEQISRLLIFFLLVLLGFFVLRPLMIPDSYGLEGRYRAKALDELKSQVPVVQGSDACVECHEDQAELWADSQHGVVECESCHRPGAEHVAAEELALETGSDAPTSSRPFVATEAEMAGFCGLCHHERVARPESFIQVDITDHYIEDPCNVCHYPHERW